MGKFLTKLSVRDTSALSFSDDNLSEYQWSLTKLGLWIDIVEIWVEFAVGF